VSPQNREDEIMATIVGTSGNDILNGVRGQDNLIYGDTSDTLSAGPGGNDTITGGANGTNTIYGDAETIMGHAGSGGADTLIGGTNSINTLVGDADTTLGAPNGGNDTLIGGVGGSNTLIGDFVDAGGGASGGTDRLVSAPNTTDDMWGDFQTVGGGNPQFGADTFVFGQHNGNDVIHDFQQGLDTIEIDTSPLPIVPIQALDHIPPHALDHIPTQAVSNFPTSFADLTIQLVDANNDGITDSVIHFDANNSVTVLNVTGLTAADFHFVV
jgi:Ca2+-binding RTX toxin-like protein